MYANLKFNMYTFYFVLLEYIFIIQYFSFSIAIGTRANICNLQKSAQSAYFPVRKTRTPTIQAKLTKSWAIYICRVLHTKFHINILYSIQILVKKLSYPQNKGSPTPYNSSCCHHASTTSKWVSI